jgi:hypothetical protein
MKCLQYFTFSSVQRIEDLLVALKDRCVAGQVLPNAPHCVRRLM